MKRKPLAGGGYYPIYTVFDEINFLRDTVARIEEPTLPPHDEFESVSQRTTYSLRVQAQARTKGLFRDRHAFLNAYERGLRQRARGFMTAELNGDLEKIQEVIGLLRSSQESKLREAE